MQRELLVRGVGIEIVPGKSLSCLPLELVVDHLNKMSITFLVFSVG